MDRGEKPRLVLPQRGRVSAAHLQPPVWASWSGLSPQLPPSWPEALQGSKQR